MNLLLAGLVVFMTHALEGVTGFGCTVLALPFMCWLVGPRIAVPVLVTLAWMLAILIVVKARCHIVWREFGRIVLYALPGLPLGMVLYRYLPERGLLILLGVFMIFVGVRGLAHHWIRHVGMTTQQTPNWRHRLALFGGGIVQGALGSGGPLVVIYAARALANKSVFRVTLCMLWFSLNSILIAGWLADGTTFRNPEILRVLAVTIPFMLAGLWTGDRLHHRVNERQFRIGIYALLALCGTVMLVNKLTK